MLVAPAYSLIHSKKRVLIVAPPYRLSQGNFPLGLMYVASALQEVGHIVQVIDMDVLNLPMDKYMKELRERDYDYFLIGGMITAWNFIVFSCNFVKQIKPHVVAIVGGGVVNSTPKSLISVSKADVGVMGDGEEAIIDVIDAIENGRSLSTVTGIVYKEENEVIQTKPRQYLRSLDSLPFPAWELFRVGEVYVRFPSQYSLFRAKRVATIATTRGCPFQCTFCYTDKKVRQRSVENVIEELKELKRRYKVGHILIADDLFVVRKKYAIEFSEAMIKHKMNLTWSATGRCNIVDKEFLRILSQGGCRFMGLGIESGSAKVLKLIKKSQTPQQIISAVKMVREAGINPGGSFILGMPPETKETIRETVEVYKEVNAYRYHVNRFFFATPYPGTELYTQMVAAGKIGDEIKYFEKLSERGDAVDFCVNCTETLSDAELIQIKKEIEEEVFQDFMKKHPIYAYKQFLDQKTPWGKIQSTLLKFKMSGFREGTEFVIKKVLSRLKLMPDQYQRQWQANKKLSYFAQQTLFEGKMPTY